jgi:hypothetical protein
MLVIPGENHAAFDCDDTLVMWFSSCNPEEKVKIVCPYGGSETWLKPHKGHIELLKKFKVRGHTIIVWSSGGVLWAEAVVKALGLEAYVDTVMTKPSKLVDDLKVTEIFPVRIYLKDGTS